MIDITTEPRSHREPLLQLEVVRPQAVCRIPPRPRLKIPILAYAIALTVMRTACYDMHWNRLAQRISEYKFHLFPELRRWQINKWVAQFQRQDLFPNATEPQLREWAKELVTGSMI